MATAESISVTIDSSKGRRRRSSSTARYVTLGAVLLGAAIGFMATARLAAVVLATPPGIWLRELPPLVGSNLAINPGLSDRAASVAKVISDPALFTAQGAVCLDTAADSFARCLALIDTALAAAPASGELWLTKARALVASGNLDEPMLEALRNSYRVARREGWIAANRVVLGLSLYPLLPPDLQTNVRGDLDLVLTETSLADSLLQSYADNVTLRTNATGALEALPVDKLEWFVHNARRAARGRSQTESVAHPNELN